MKFSELIICIGVMVCIGIGGFSVFYSYMRGNERGMSAVQDSQLVLKTDVQLRTKIEQIIVPYWVNGGQYVEDFGESVRNKGVIHPDIEIVSVHPVLDKYDRVRGVTVAWVFNERQFETTALFGSVPVLGGV